MNKQTVLVVDDDESTRTYISRLLSSQGYSVDDLASGERVLARIDSDERPSIMLLDVLMPTVGGLEVLTQMKERGRSVPTIVLSGVAEVGTVVKAMKLGACDYLLKPFDEEELEAVIRNTLQARARDGEGQRGDFDNGNSSSPDFSSKSGKIERIKQIARRVADADVPVLILGESGVGKEVIAKYIHRVSPRCIQPFVKVNCAALPADLLESELFGYERGAFTGALREKKGKFELADKGTILLDEIGEMSPLLQAKLLHVLQDGEYARLGGTRVIRVDARVIATTNKRLDEAVAKGEFRLDLYYRLNVIKLEIPPLRERREDIPHLCNLFLAKYLSKYGRPPLQLPPDLVDALHEYDWPGNVRQLENTIKRIAVLGEADGVLPDLNIPRARAEDPDAGDSVHLKKVSAKAAEQAEKELVLRLLHERNWNRKQVAQELNICYKSLLNKLHRWQLPTRGRSFTAARGSHGGEFGQ